VFAIKKRSSPVSLAVSGYGMIPDISVCDADTMELIRKLLPVPESSSPTCCLFRVDLVPFREVFQKMKGIICSFHALLTLFSYEILTFSRQAVFLFAAAGLVGDCHFNIIKFQKVLDLFVEFPGYGLMS